MEKEDRRSKFAAEYAKQQGNTARSKRIAAKRLRISVSVEKGSYSSRRGKAESRASGTSGGKAYQGGGGREEDSGRVPRLIR